MHQSIHLMCVCVPKPLHAPDLDSPGLGDTLARIGGQATP